ncbi:MOLPALP family lipoprotein [Mesoplasma lactucae]|uniref:Uncharacterized protein n=1 Tax=Mesoplasma lactucae ATCC 49193 TaxID=81460 RepID=A0A291IR48_9MOLU|nr:MOLPALP family lipoprotein [Mesoplasma lactucae]ATG97214.1 hypothetical protein CP520_00340 [Mesoplasma lactucae ATCC 49193]ATZ20344.1 hypothetical protein MLACT_v1c05230 [Mesoplasma lactucae ATCC 49193]MCL8216515.1 hypothetical protein [Mesoplasma lactucae ATCC 49193]
MKKMLSILAAIGIVGSSASTVVACGMKANYKVESTKPETPNSDKDNSSTKPSQQPSGVDFGDSTRGELPKPTNPDEPDKTIPPVKPVTPNKEEFDYQNQDNIMVALQQVVQKTIYQDQYGFDGSYLNKLIYNDSTLDWTKDNTNADLDKVKSEHDALTTDSISAFTSHYLGKVEGNINLNGDKGLDNAKPFNDALPKQASDALNTADDYINKVGIYSPSGLFGLLSTGLTAVGLDSVATQLLSYRQTIEEKVDPILNNLDVKNVIDSFSSPDLIKKRFGELSVFDSQKSMMIGIAWILAVGAGDEKQIDAFYNMEDISIYQKAMDYLVDLVGNVNKNGQTSSIKKENYTKYLFNEDKTMNNDHLQKLLNNGYSTVDIFAGYIQAFSNYKVAEPTDSDHIFSVKESNWTVINRIRQTKIKDSNLDLTLNIHSFVADLDYYLGDFDSDKGMYRIQALLAIFCQDRDYKGNWTNAQKGKALLLDWNDNLNHQIDINVNTPAVTFATKVIAKQVDVEKVLKDAGVDWLVSLLGYPITNETLQQITYQLFMSLSTQVQVQLSNGMYNKICKKGGWLSVLPYIDESWFNQLLNNPLQFLYKGDLIAWLNNFTNAIHGTSVASRAVANKIINEAKPGIDKVVQSLKPLADKTGRMNLQILFTRPLSDLLSSFNLGLFNENKYRFAPEFASFYTDKTLSELVNYLASDMLKVNKMDNRDTLKKYSLDPSRLKPIFDACYLIDENGNEHNIVDLFFEALKEPNGVKRVNNLSNLLGIIGINKYDENKILGKFLIFFLPEVKTNNLLHGVDKKTGIHYVKGDDKLQSELITTVLGFYQQFIKEVNIKTDYDKALKAVYSERKEEFKQEEPLNLSDDLLSGSQTISYSWIAPDKTIYQTTYSFTFHRDSLKQKFTTEVNRSETTITPANSPEQK